MIEIQCHSLWCQILLLLAWDIPGESYQESIIVPPWGGGGGGGFFPSPHLLGTTSIIDGLSPPRLII